jgi:hypothetical protein
VLAGQRDLGHALGDRSNLRLAVEAEESRPGVEDAVAVGREARQQLLGALEPESPVDDRKAEDVEPLGGRKGGGAFRRCSAQGPYLATARRRKRKKAGEPARPAGDRTEESAT